MPAKRGALGSSWCQAALHPPQLPLPWGSHDLPCRLCPRCDLEKFSSFIQIKSAYLGAPRVKEGGRVWSNWGDSRNLPRTLSPRPGGRCPGEKQSAVGWPRPCSGVPTLRGEGPVLTRGTLRRTRGLVSWRGRPRGPCRRQGIPGARSLLSPPPPRWSCPDGRLGRLVTHSLPFFSRNRRRRPTGPRCWRWRSG